MADEKKKTELIIDNFGLQQIAFEIRHFSSSDGEDKKSNLFEKIQNQLPHPIKLVEQNKERVSFTYNKNFEFNFGVGRFSIINVLPDKTLKELLEVAKIFTETVTEDFNIVQFTRVGLRPTFVYVCENATEIAELLYRTPYFQYPENLYLKESGKPLVPNCAFGWQSDEKGITYRIRGESGQLKVDLPLLFTASGEYPESIVKEINHVILDIDLFIHKPISPGQFFVEDWIIGAFETIKKEGHKLFGGKND